MAISSCTKRNSGDSVDRKKGETQAFEDRQTEEWDIVTDVAGYSSSRIIAEAPLPYPYSPHPDNPNLRCTGEHQIRRVDGSPIHFVAIVTYDTPPPGSALPEPQETPDDKRPEKRDREPYSEEWSTVKTQEPIDVDIQGKAICTVNGEQFDPPLTTDVYDIQMTFGKNVNQKNQALIEAVGRTNADNFEGFGQFQCVIDQVQYKYLLDPDSNKAYWRQTVTVMARTKVPPNFAPGDAGLLTKVWDLRVRAEGYKVKVDGDDTPQNAKDGEGNPSAVPVLHDTTTGQIIDSPNNAQWYRFVLRTSANYAALQIK